MNKQLIERLVRPEIRALSAYHVPPAKGLIKLDAMENPFSWPLEVKQSWQQKLLSAEINRYPDPAATGVADRLKAVMKVPDQYGVLLGNGSDEIIQLLAMAVNRDGGGILAPEPGFVMYRMIATFIDLPYVGVPLAADFDLDLDAMLAAIKAHQPSLIFLAVPNNPTGNVFALDKVRKIIGASEGLVIVDEAYTAFTEADHLSLLDDYDNVLVMRTLSKVGLAGLRLGMLFGRPEWLIELDKLRLPYNINVLTQLSAEFALDNYGLLMEQAETLRALRAELIVKLKAMPALEVFPSEANFVLVRLSGDYSGRAAQVHAAMRDSGVLVKSLDMAHPMLADCLRLTVGSEDENSAMLEALSEALKG